VKSQRHWLANLQWAAYASVLVLAAWFALHKNGKQQEFLIIAVFGGVIIFANLQRMVARIHGQSVEKRAIKDLGKFAKDELVANVPLPGRGDIDAVLKLRHGTFNIEIKSIQDPQKVTWKHVKQAKAASDYLQSTPVIWLPKCKSRTVTSKSGIKIFGGSARQLYSHLN